MSLSRYAPELVSTEELQVGKFVDGLRHAIKSIVVSGLNKTYEDYVSAAMKVEASLLERQKALDTCSPRPPGQSFGSHPIQGLDAVMGSRGGGGGGGSMNRSSSFHMVCD